MDLFPDIWYFDAIANGQVINISFKNKYVQKNKATIFKKRKKINKWIFHRDYCKKKIGNFLTVSLKPHQ